MQIEKIQSSTELTVFHLRAARATLKLSLKELAEMSTISERALLRLEKGSLEEAPKSSSLVTIGKVRAIYEENGIEFYKTTLFILFRKKIGLLFESLQNKIWYDFRDLSIYLI